jgi:hypothetical protein
MNDLRGYSSDIGQELSSEKERAGARTARSICGERCGVGLAKVWGKKIPTLESLPMPLTIKNIENAKSREKKYKLADGGGLCLVVQSWGGKF